MQFRHILEGSQKYPSHFCFCLVRKHGYEYTTPKCISDCFNKYFSTVCSKLAALFEDNVSNDTVLYLDITKNLTFQPIDAEFVQKKFSVMQKGKATWLDNLHTRLLKDTFYIIAKPLCHIMNASLKEGTYTILMENNIWKKYI